MRLRKKVFSFMIFSKNQNLTKGKINLLVLTWLLCMIMAFAPDIFALSFQKWYVRLVFFFLSVLFYGSMSNIVDDVKKKKIILLLNIGYILSSLMMLLFLPMYNLGLTDNYFIDSMVSLITVILYFAYQIFKNFKNKNNKK